MISVNRVRNTVLFLLAKNNKGYVDPMKFDSLSYLAQMDLFENLFYRYNKWKNNESKRFSNTEFADIPKNIQEQIDVFSMYTTPANFTYDSSADLWSYSGNDLYRTIGLSLKNAQGKLIDMEEFMKGAELNNKINSKINPPTFIFPIYTKMAHSYRAYPKTTIASGYTVEMFYIRTPKSPKWSYVTVAGNPIFDAGSSDLQNFELDESMYSLLVAKILGYCGLSIRETEVVEIASAAEQEIELKQS